MSRADFWALSAIVAVEEATRQTNQVFCAGKGRWCKFPSFPINFQYGRKDCPTSPFYPNTTTQETGPELPSAQ